MTVTTLPAHTPTTLTPGADGATDVLRGDAVIGHVQRLGRSWYWKGAGDAKWCPVSQATRKAAVQRVEFCADTRAAHAAADAATAARLAEHHERVLADGYAPADIADVTPGQMVRYRTRDGYWSGPVLATKAEVFDNGGAILIYTPVVGNPLPTDCVLLTQEGSRSVMVRERTRSAEDAWARWLAATDDSPAACAARAVPPGWTPAPWDGVGVDHVIRYATRIRNGMVYEWSGPRIITSIDRLNNGTVSITYAYTDLGTGDEVYSHAALQAPVAAHGVLRPPREEDR